MCVIVDASVAGRVFSVPYEVDYAPLWRWLKEKDGKLVYGGQLAKELDHLPNAKRILAELKSEGRALLCSRQKVDDEEKGVRMLGLCRSNDTHVIALARVSSARVLCTNDSDLEADFKNRKLVAAPKGKIYKKAGHASLLKHNGKCIGRPK